MSNNEKLSTQVIAELEAENARLRQIIRALLRDTNGQDKDTITSSTEIVSEEKKEVTK